MILALLYSTPMYYMVLASIKPGFGLNCDPAKYYGKSPEININDNSLTTVETDQAELDWRFAGNNWKAQTCIYYSWSDIAVTNDSNLNVVIVDNKTRDFGFEGALTRYVEHGFETGVTLHWVRKPKWWLAKTRCACFLVINYLLISVGPITTIQHAQSCLRH